MDEPSRAGRINFADVVFGVVAAILGSFFVLAVWTDSSESHPGAIWELVVGGTSLIVLVLFRRKYTVWVAVGLLVPELISASGIGAAAMAVCTVAIRRPWPITAAMAALHVGTLSAFWLLAEPNNEEAMAGITVIGLLYTTLVTSGMLIRVQRKLVLSLRERARQAEEGQRMRVEEARHNERERLAREMHDVLAHRISLLAVHAGALEYRGKLPPEEARAAAVIRQCAHDALEDLREVITMLRESSDGNGDRPLPTLTDLPELIEQSREAGAHVGFEDRCPDPAAVPTKIGRHAYRIVQEGLTNARKHAPGTKVQVTVDVSADGELAIEVANPLPAGPARDIPGAGAGLIGLGERVALVGGRLQHGTTPDGRFRLRAWLPLPQ